MRVSAALPPAARTGRLLCFLLALFAITACGTSGPAAAGSAPALAVIQGGSGAATFANLSAAVAGYGSVQATIQINTPQKANNLSIPANISLQFAGQGSIEVAAGKSVTLGGPFDAPLSRVFLGPGVVRFASGSLSRVHPEWWGAGDGLPSAPAIQSAIDSLEKGEVALSTGTYLLERRQRIRLIGSPDAVDTILVPKSGVSIVGGGYGSVLKVVDNFTAGGDYVLFAPLNAEPVSDVTFTNFRIDGNAPHNLVRGATGGLLRRAMAIWLFSGARVKVSGVWFEDQPGTNVVKFGSDSLSYLVTDSVVENCAFTRVGGAIAGNRGQADHSSLYVSGRNVTVQNNRLSNPQPLDENATPVAVVAGIEMHGFDLTVTGNRVENYGTGGYIVADGVVAAANQNWTKNSFVNMTKIGISLWSVQQAKNIVIDSNSITLLGGLDQCVAGIFQALVPPDTTMGFDGLSITGNTISGGSAKPGTVWNGIQLTAVSNAVISGNSIDTVSGGGILLYGNRMLPLDCRNILIQGNTVRDTGFNLFGAYPYAIDISNQGQGSFSDIRVVGNLLVNSGVAPAMSGIRVEGKGPMARVQVESSNLFTGIAAERQISLGAPAPVP
jgi:hypothetical protein